MTKSQIVLRDVLMISRTLAPLGRKMVRAMGTVARFDRSARQYYRDVRSADVEGRVRTDLTTLRDLLLQESTRRTALGADSQDVVLLEALWDRLSLLTV